MRVYPIGFQAPVCHNRKPMVYKQNTLVTRPVSFRGNLKFGDYVAGAVSGIVMGTIGFAIAGPVGAVVLGAICAKTTAETNNETRPYEPDED